MTKIGFFKWFALDSKRVIMGSIIVLFCAIFIIGGIREIDANGIYVVIFCSIVLLVFAIGNYANYRKYIKG